MSKTRKQNNQKDPYNFFGRTWIIFACLLIFAPAGIYLLWKNKKFDPAVRLLLSAIFGLVFIYNSWGLINPDTTPTTPQTPAALTGSAAGSEGTKPQAAPAEQEEYIPPVLPSPDFTDKRTLKVHFLDVGQADCTVIQTPEGNTFLIDGGNRDDGDFIKSYLADLGVTELAAVIATHPHADHIGGLPEVMASVPVKSFYMPEVTHTTESFENLLSAAEKSTAAKIPARVGKSIPCDELYLSMIFLAPNSSNYEDLNNYSAVLKVTYKDISFILTGDAEELSEQEMLSNNRNVNATVLKVGHHGSRTSSSPEFLEAVNPAYAVISCSQDNEYGYPHAETMQNLRKEDTGILRTDILGTLIMETDGERLGITSHK